MAKKLLAVCISIFLAALLLEIGLVLLGFGEPILYRVGGNYQYRLVPNQKKRMIGAIVEINSWGMRGDEPNKAKEKIIFYGDSITYGGNGLPNASTFASLIDEHLSESNYQTLNAGVNGYGPENIKELFFFHRANHEFSNIVVVIPTVDLLRPLKVDGFFELYEEDDVFVTRSHLFLKVLFDRLERLVDLRVFDAPKDPAAKKSERKNSESIALDNIENYQSIINHSPRILIFFVPSRDENMGTTPDVDYRAMFIKELSRNKTENVKIVDLSPLLNVFGSTIYRDTVHFNSEGHKILADLMYPYIAQHFE